MEQNINEIQELKEQLAALNSKLDKQAEIGDNMIKKALKSSIGRLQNLGNKKLAFCIIAPIFVLLIMFLQGLGWVIIAATAVMFAVNAWVQYLLCKKERELVGDGDLLGTMRRVVDYKRLHRNTTLWATPIAILWAVWYVYEVGKELGFLGGREFLGLALACLIGGVIGWLIGYFSFYLPTRKTADEIIDQINDLTGKK